MLLGSVRAQRQRCAASGTNAELERAVRAVSMRKVSVVKGVFMTIYHRYPAPTVRTMAASSIRARVKRARFAFTG